MTAQELLMEGGALALLVSTIVLVRLRLLSIRYGLGWLRITDATSGFRAIRAPLLNFFAEEYPVEYLGDTVEALVSAGRRRARVVEHPITASRRQHALPSAGLIASGWYVVRVLAAASLVQSRTPPEPLYRSPAEEELMTRSGDGLRSTA